MDHRRKRDRRRLWIAALLGVLLAIVAIFLRLAPREPPTVPAPEPTPWFRTVPTVPVAVADAAPAEPKKKRRWSHVGDCRPGRTALDLPPKSLCTMQDGVRICSSRLAFNTAERNEWHVGLRSMLDEAAHVLALPPPRGIEVVVYELEEWAKLLESEGRHVYRRRNGEPLPTIAGLQDAGAIRLWNRDGMESTARHEVMHFVLWTAAACVPVGFNEGLAQWFAGGDSMFKFEYLLDSDRSLMTDVDLKFHTSWEGYGPRTAEAYAGAHARVQLAVDKHGEETLARTVAFVARGGDPDRVWEQLNDSATQEQLRDMLSVWVTGQEWSPAAMRARRHCDVAWSPKAFEWGSRGRAGKTTSCRPRTAECDDDIPMVWHKRPVWKDGR